MNILIKNIKGLVQVREATPSFLKGKEMQDLPMLSDAFLYIENDVIKDYGAMNACTVQNADEIIDADGRYVLPAWIDSHTHLVYAGNREQEFVDRINGLSYDEIYQRGGGILNSSKKLQETSAEDLYEQSSVRLEEIMALGTGAVEIKSGYGLSTESEIKMLEVIHKLKENYPVTIKSTFLGAHAIPLEYKENRKGYIDLICNEMIPEIASKNLADYVDSFLETGYFTIEETRRIIETGNQYGLKAKIHVNQFTAIGGIKACVNLGALSVDHLEVMNEEDYEILKDSQTMPVALPTCSYFISIPYTPGRKMIDDGLPLALASDYNPGTTPSGNMNFVVATACIKMRITPEEAINAATINAAYAMDLLDTHGSITKGKKANVIITKKMHSIYEIPYKFGNNPVEQVIINGIVI